MTTAEFSPVGISDQNDIVSGNSHLLIAEKVTIKAGSGDLPRGAVLGKVTAGGKCVISLAAAADGSEKPVRILAYDVVAGSSDVEALAFRRGDFIAGCLTYGTGHTAESVIEALGPDSNIQIIKEAM